MQEFFRSVCSGRGQGGVGSPQRESLCIAGGVLGGLCGLDELRPECAGVGGLGALAGLGGANDGVDSDRVVNKRLIRQTAGEEMVSIMGGGKEATSNTGAAIEVRGATAELVLKKLV